MNDHFTTDDDTHLGDFEMMREQSINYLRNIKTGVMGKDLTIDIVFLLLIVVVVF